MGAPKIETDYEQLEQIIKHFQAEQQRLEGTHKRVKAKMETLTQKGWRGQASRAFRQEMEGVVLPRLQRLSHALGQAATTTRKISSTMQVAEEEARRLFPAGGMVGLYDALTGGLVTGLSGLDKINEANKKYLEAIGIKDPFEFTRKAPYNLLYGTSLEVAMHYFTGDDAKDPDKILRALGLKKDNLVMAALKNAEWDAKLFSIRDGGGEALFDGRIGGDLLRQRLMGTEWSSGLDAGIGKDGLYLKGDLHGEAFVSKTNLNFGDVADGSLTIGSVEGNLGGQYSLNAQGLNAKVEAYVALNAIKGEASLNAAGFEVKGNGLAGAYLTGTAQASINPFNGELGVKAEGEAFIGGKIQASVEREITPWFKAGAYVEGSAGAGIHGAADIGINDNGVFRFKLGGGGAIGLGGGGGLSFELDIPKAGQSLVDAGRDGLKFLESL